MNWSLSQKVDWRKQFRAEAVWKLYLGISLLELSPSHLWVCFYLMGKNLQRGTLWHVFPEYMRSGISSHLSREFPSCIICFAKSHPYSLTYGFSVVPQLHFTPNTTGSSILSHWVYTMYGFSSCTGVWVVSQRICRRRKLSLFWQFSVANTRQLCVGLQSTQVSLMEYCLC